MIKLVNILNEALFGKKLDIQYHRNVRRAILSKNTIPHEREYRLTWFLEKECLTPRGHIDLTKEEMEHFLSNNELPLRYKSYEIKILSIVENQSLPSLS